MVDSDRYVKIVEWSNDDECYIGSSPALLYGGCQFWRPTTLARIRPGRERMSSLV